MIQLQETLKCFILTPSDMPIASPSLLKVYYRSVSFMKKVLAEATIFTGTVRKGVNLSRPGGLCV